MVTTVTGRAGASQVARMVIATEDGRLSVDVRYAPRVVSSGELAGTWTSIERPGLAPLLSRGQQSLEAMTFDLLLASTTIQSSVEDQITDLRALSNSSQRLRVSYGPSEGGLWRMTSLQVVKQERNESDQVSRATAAVTLTRASDARVQVGPVSGGHNGGGGGAPRDRVYVVKKGDTLVSISTKFYKSPKYWRRIAKVNKVRNAKRSKKLNPGRKLKIPRLK